MYTKQLHQHYDWFSSPEAPIRWAVEENFPLPWPSRLSSMPPLILPWFTFFLVPPHPPSSDQYPPSPYGTGNGGYAHGILS